MVTSPRQDLLRLRQALEQSWDADTANMHISEPGNPALGQCYPTARVIQHFFPELEIIKGTVVAADERHVHFWNALIRDGAPVYHIDLTWQQFPPKSKVQEYQVLDRDKLGDSPPTITRCDLLLERVKAQLSG